MKARTTVAFLLCCFTAISAEAADIRVVTSPGLSAVFKVVGPEFERSTGHSLVFRYGLQAEQKKQIEAGDFDLAIVPSDVLDAATKTGMIVAKTRTSVARVDLGVGVRDGTAKPELGSVDAFKRAMLDASSVTFVLDEATGVQIVRGFEKLGIAEIMKAKIKPQKAVPLVWKAVATGSAELGFGFSSNILAAQGVQLASHFPTELQYYVEMTAGLGSTAREADGALAFISFLRTPRASSVFAAKGLVLPRE